MKDIFAPCGLRDWAAFQARPAERTRAMPLRECLRIEYELACEVTRGPEFSEGVRAMLVDKDRSPIWPSANFFWTGNRTPSSLPSLDLPKE